MLIPELACSAGFITELTGQDFPRGGVPVAGAKVRMAHQLNEAGKPIEGSVWEHVVTTDEAGYFDTSDYAAPSKEAKVGLEVSKEGYNNVYTTYIDYSDVEPQVFLIVLTPRRAD